MATTSPEPCHGIGDTHGGWNACDASYGVREPCSRCSGGRMVAAAKKAAGPACAGRLPNTKKAGRKRVRPGFSDNGDGGASFVQGNRVGSATGKKFAGARH